MLSIAGNSVISKSSMSTVVRGLTTYPVGLDTDTGIYSTPGTPLHIPEGVPCTRDRTTFIGSTRERTELHATFQNCTLTQDKKTNYPRIKLEVVRAIRQLKLSEERS